MEKMIYLDMDNTLNSFYNDDWLECLQARNTKPYDVAPCVVSEETLMRFIKCGYKVGIISWLSKNSTKEFDIRVRRSKKAWLKKYYPNITFSEIHIVKYGTPKYSVAKVKDSYLFDDEKQNLEAWKGIAINAAILQKLQA